MQVEIKKLNPAANVPQYQTAGSAGLDLSSVEPTFVLQPNEVKLIGTGLSVYIKDSNYVGLLTPRSGTGHKRGLILGNGIGVIDSDYQGELKISLWNRSDTPQFVNQGERVAQLLIVPVKQVTLKEVAEFSTGESERGSGGFGSTGTNS